MRYYLSKLMLLSMIYYSSGGFAMRSLTPPAEPKDDSFYICYEKRFLNNVTTQEPIPCTRGTGACARRNTHTILPMFKSYKYIGCIISRLPCQMYTGDKFHARPAHLRQFQWMDTYPKALNSFYRCAYS